MSRSKGEAIVAVKLADRSSSPRARKECTMADFLKSAILRKPHFLRGNQTPLKRKRVSHVPIKQITSAKSGHFQQCLHLFLSFPCRIQDLTWLQADVAVNIQNKVEPIGRLGHCNPMFSQREAWWWLHLPGKFHGASNQFSICWF